MTDMTRKEILPAVMAYSNAAAEGVSKRKTLDPSAACAYETKLLKRLGSLSDCIDQAAEELEKDITELDSLENVTFQSVHIRDIIIPKMAELRTACDEAETLTARSYWPFPTYGDLLFGV
jgi:glutamine synthetase